MSGKQAFLGGSPWWIVMGIGLTAGCTDTESIDRLDDVPMTCTPESRTYQLTSIDPSMRNSQWIDLDDNGNKDNMLGRAHDMIAQLAPGFAVEPRFTERLVELSWLVTIDQCGDEVRVTIDQGFGTIAQKVLPRAVGTKTGDAISARDGLARVPLTALADPLRIAAPGWTDGDGLAIEAIEQGDTLTGVFAVGIETEHARTELAPPIAAFLTTQPSDNLLRTGADANVDGIVTADELAATVTYQGLIQSDVVIRETPSSSLALAFTATRVR